MSKLVAAEIWAKRNFEPGSEPKLEALEEWALTTGKGEIIDKLYIYDDALLPANDSKCSVTVQKLLEKH